MQFTSPYKFLIFIGMFSILLFKLCSPDFKIGLRISRGKKRELIISNSNCAHKKCKYVCLFLLCMKVLMCEMQLPHALLKNSPN